jgi:hypothetical protein
MASLLRDIRDSGLRNLALSLILIAIFLVFWIVAVSVIVWKAICWIR